MPAPDLGGFEETPSANQQGAHMGVQVGDFVGGQEAQTA